MIFHSFVSASPSNGLLDPDQMVRLPALFNAYQLFTFPVPGSDNKTLAISSWLSLKTLAR